MRGKATGTPSGEFWGAKPTGNSFSTMAIDILTVTNAKLASAYHVENWLGALQQIKFESAPEEPVVLPAAAVRLLGALLTELAKGNAVTLMPHHAELTNPRGGGSAQCVAPIPRGPPRERSAALPQGGYASPSPLF